MLDELAPLTECDALDRRTWLEEVKPNGAPIVLRGQVSHWPIVHEGRGSGVLAKMLKARATKTPARVFCGAPGINGKFTYTDDIRGFNFESRQLSVEDLISHLEVAEEEPRAETYYAGSLAAETYFPGLLSEQAFDLLDETEATETFFWIGGRSRVAAHFDTPDNLACVAAGRRRFILFPPDQVKNLYVGPLDFTPAGPSSSLVDFHHPDFDRYPTFREALGQARMAILEPGDVLFIPSLWWHHIESLDPFGVLVNFWSRAVPPYMDNPINTLLCGLLSIRDLPEREREAWRTLFDHYLFRPPEGGGVAHIPEDAQGVLGPLTPERAAQIRTILINKLNR